MASWGKWLIVYVLLSIVLPKFGVQILLLMWVDNWGSTVGWIIRGALALVGVAMIVLDKPFRKGSDAAR